MHQTQYYNSNFKDKDPNFNPGVSKITLLKDPHGEDIALGTILVKTDEYVQDLRNISGLGKRFSEEVTEDIDVGHQDNEPAMVKKQLYNIIRNAKSLFDKLGKYESGEEVDFPAWWQSKITKSQSYLSGAFNYLDSEEAVEEGKYKSDAQRKAIYAAKADKEK